MYHCHLRFYFLSHRSELFTPLKEMPPLEAFTHEFRESEKPERDLAAKADLILADLRETDARETVRSLKTWKKAEAQLIVLAQKDQVEHLTDLFPEIADIWTLPVSEAELRFYFLRWQQDCKVRKDYWQTSHYLECAINCSPNL